ncbi:acyltransferase family protein [Blastococcus sp. SYSU D00820]
MDVTRTGEPPRLRALDGLRFLAAAAVVAFHYTGRDSTAWPESVRTVFPTISRFTIYGGFGPYLFFIISGFVVLMSAWDRPARSFLASRVGRLFPAYWIAVVLTAGVLLLDPRAVPAVWENLGLSGVALNLTMLQSAFGVGNVDGVYWTLWVELKFYLLLGLLALAGITRRRVLALCLVWPLLGALAGQLHADLLTALLEPLYAPFFCIGLLLYLVYREGWSPSVGLLLAFDYVAALRVCDTHFRAWTLDVAGAGVSFAGVAVLLTLCIGAVVLVTLTPVARLDWRWLTLLGALTYPLYLVHQYVGWVLIRHLTPRLPVYAVLAVVVALMLLVAYAVHRLVERPLGPRLRRAVERELAALAAGRPAPQPEARPAALPEEPAADAGPHTVVPAPRPQAPHLLARRPVPPARPGPRVPAPADRHPRTPVG